MIRYISIFICTFLLFGSLPTGAQDSMPEYTPDYSTNAQKTEDEVGTDPISSFYVKRIWARETSKSARTAAVYFKISSAFDYSLTLTGASTPKAEKVEIHKTIEDNGVMKMEQQNSVLVEPTKDIILEPGGLHLMLIGLKEPLTEGEHFPLTLNFNNWPDFETKVRVFPASFPGPVNE